MTTATTTLNAAISSDATFRTWGAGVKALFTAAGVVQTSDTGQINWASVTKAVAANTVQGYEVWRFNDTLQATAPVFIKVEYISSPNTSGNAQSLRLTVGTGSNGSGTITGVNTGTQLVRNYTSTNADTNTAQKAWACHASGTFSAWSEQGSGVNNPFSFIICRTVNSSGALTGDGLYFVYSATTGVTLSVSMNFNTSTLLNATLPAAGPTADLLAYNFGNTRHVFQHYACLPAPFPVHLVSMDRNSLGDEGLMFPLSINGGTARTYRVVGLTTGTYPFDYPTMFTNTSMSGLVNESIRTLALVWE